MYTLSWIYGIIFYFQSFRSPREDMLKPSGEESWVLKYYKDTVYQCFM